MMVQPPPRGCVLKQEKLNNPFVLNLQPPPRGCVLKHLKAVDSVKICTQPPPRGCVLKRKSLSMVEKQVNAAASARLCVETAI